MFAAPFSGRAQAAAAGSSAPLSSRVDVYGGYAYFHPVNGSTSSSTPFQPILWGGVASITAYFGNHLGVQAEGQVSPDGPNDCFYSAEAGPVLRFPAGRFVPFIHLLGGGAMVGGPTGQPCTWGYGADAGAGIDFILPGTALRNRIALRPIQADFDYAYVNYGTSPAGFSTTAQITAYRLSAGLVFRLGASAEAALPASYACDATPVSVYPGEPVAISGSTLNLEENRRLKPVYTWASTGGQISGSEEAATVTTTGLASGDYTVTGRVSEGSKPTQRADCSTSFRVIAYQAPTLTCSANPSTVQPGGASTITAAGSSPQGRALTYSFGASAGQIAGQTAGAGTTTATFVAKDAGPGVVQISCNVVDSQGLSAVASATVTVVAPPPPPAPSTRSLCGISFERDRKHPVRVDNEAKGCLDDVALALNREADATLVVVGEHDPQEDPEAAAERALNVKLYLGVEKGIDPTRIQLRTREATSRGAADILVPAGATWDPAGTSSFDPARIKLRGEAYGPAKK